MARKYGDATWAGVHVFEGGITAPGAGVDSLRFGSGTLAGGESSMSFGLDFVTDAPDYSMLFGNWMDVSATSNDEVMALGHGIIIGNNCGSSILMGPWTELAADCYDTTAFGYANWVDSGSYRSCFFGSLSINPGTYRAVAVGWGSSIRGEETVSVGFQASIGSFSISVPGAILIGALSGIANQGVNPTTSPYAIGIGYSVRVAYDSPDSIVIGPRSKTLNASGATPTNDCVMLGADIVSRGKNNILAGQNVETTAAGADDNVLIGRDLQTDGSKNTVVGVDGVIVAGVSYGMGYGEGAKVWRNDQFTIGRETRDASCITIFRSYEVGQVGHSTALVVGDVVILPGAGIKTCDISTAVSGGNQKCPVVVKRAVSAGIKTEVAVGGAVSVFVDPTTVVSAGDTLVTSSVTDATAMVDNTETDPSKILGWAWESKTTGGSRELVLAKAA